VSGPSLSLSLSSYLPCLVDVSSFLLPPSSTYIQSFLYYYYHHRHRLPAFLAYGRRYYHAVAPNKLDCPLKRDPIVAGDKISICLNVPRLYQVRFMPRRDIAGHPEYHAPGQLPGGCVSVPQAHANWHRRRLTAAASIVVRMRLTACLSHECDYVLRGLVTNRSFLETAALVRLASFPFLRFDLHFAR